VDAFADRGEQDDCRDADGDAEQRQETAQALGGDGTDGELRESASSMASASSRLAPGRGGPRGGPA
jgi:hypothetical protein